MRLRIEHLLVAMYAVTALEAVAGLCVRAVIWNRSTQVDNSTAKSTHSTWSQQNGNLR
ncbi:hypothetical protein FHS14_005428 [Paenibacillus baekrokdamisoli]|uniref:hypothetical protein n=1 Tax=Paenibacillus baekrokdamisoli TaxID=1712516 RepID=UPI0013DEBFB7|nr:hypothetical protein [Paenibacillus baekrokdamisoli]MBB3072396.1 hypothetical protein [Paenibacillus baekrokdamisoli]